MDQNKLKALQQALSQIEKHCGKGSVMKLGDRTHVEVDTISTGCLSMDVALGIGGVPRGRIVEIYGPESSGKTTFALNVIAEAQKAGGLCAFVDAEHALNPLYAKKLGVDIDNLYLSQPDHGEQALEITETLVRSGAVDVVVIDSVAALVPKSELEGDMDQHQIGGQARMMSKALRKITGIIAKTNCVVIFINQTRVKIAQGPAMFSGPSETTTGGNALKFYASVRIEIKRATHTYNANKEVTGNTTRINIVKNKFAPPFKKFEIKIDYLKGVDRLQEIVELGVKAGVLEKSGSWYSHAGLKLGQGADSVKKYLQDNTSAAKEIEAEIRKKANNIDYIDIYAADESDEEAADMTEEEAVALELVPNAATV